MTTPATKTIMETKKTTEMTSATTATMTAAATTDAAAPAADRAGTRLWRAPQLPFRGIRARILVPFVGLLALATAASVLIAREVLLNRMDNAIAAELVQEARELGRLAGGIDPATSRPFGKDVARIFDVFLQRNVPSRGEALLTFVDGALHARSRPAAPYRLEEDPKLVARWARLKATDRGRVQTPAGEVDYLAVPLRAEGVVRGVFVVAVFRDLRRGELDAAVRAAAIVGVVILLIGSALGWFVAESLLRPVRAATDAARASSETNLTQRIPVSGDDEVANLARTFNALLDRLEAAFRRERRFLSEASHELRTPITICRGHLEVLGPTPDPDEMRETIAVVVDELARMGRIVEDLTTLARAESPDFLRREEIVLGRFLDEVAAKAEPLLDGRLRVAAPPAQAVLRADPQRMTQALINLLNNAAVHGGTDAPVELRVRPHGGSWRFEVADEGGGVPPGMETTIFQPFYRGDAAVPGTGLGLAIVRGIAEAHGGRAGLDNRVGEGATFWIEVPR